MGLSKQRGTGLALWAALALVASSTAAIAPAAHAAEEAECRWGTCEFRAEEPGTPTPADPKPVVDPSQGAPQDPNYCRQWEGTNFEWKLPYSCASPYDPRLDCVWRAQTPQQGPPAGKEAADGAWYECGPESSLLIVHSTRWFDYPDSGPEIAPEVAARQVVAQMQLEGIDMGMAPRSTDEAPQAMGAVGLPAWFWVRNLSNERAWGPYTVTRTVEGLEVTATARPRFITWDTGDGGSVRCTRAGMPYREDYGRDKSPDCGHVYTEMGYYRVTATTTWAVEWAAGGESGVIETQTRSSAPVTIGELRAVNVTPPGG